MRIRGENLRVSAERINKLVLLQVKCCTVHQFDMYILRSMF